jgi:hypothetical protein
MAAFSFRGLRKLGCEQRTGSTDFVVEAYSTTMAEVLQS